MFAADLLPYVGPLMLIATAGLILLSEALEPGEVHAGQAWLAGAAFVAAGAAALFGQAGPPLTLFPLGMSMGVLDGLARAGGVVIAVTGALTVPLSYDDLRRRGLPVAEHLALLLFAGAGLILWVAARNLVLLFLALELFSLSLYVLAGYARESAPSREAALKYFLLGSFASALFLLGIAFVYSAAGTLDLAGVQWWVQEHRTPPPVFLVGAALLLAGLAFKVAAFPFHQWAPDVYQGAPTPVAAFLAAGSKAAGVVALVRIFVVAFGPAASAWRPLVAAMAAATMVIGNLGALAQGNLKRLLAYSRIAPAGYALVGIAAGTAEGGAAAVFYLGAYGLMTVGAFALLTLVETGPEGPGLEDVAGLSATRPAASAALAVCLVSLIGLPPTGGFLAKFYVFRAGVQSGLTWLVLLGVIMSAVSAVYYLRVVRLAYLDPPSDGPATAGRTPPSWSGSRGAEIVLAVCAAGVLILGVWPHPWLALARTALNLPSP